MKKIRLFALKGGVELMDKDFMYSVHGHKYLFYSLGKCFQFINCCFIIFTIKGEDFDHSVRMEFIEIKKKLGEGGFGAVYLAYD